MYLIPDPRSLIPSSDPRSLIPDPFHKGFTLVELLIVIGIIAILAGVLLGNYSNITNRVKAAKCQTNLRNLAQAVGSYLVSSGRYPFAGTAEYIRTTGGTDNQGLEIR